MCIRDRPSTIAKWFDKNSGLALSILFGITALGGVILPLISQMSITEYGWRNGWMVLGAIMFLTGVLPSLIFVRSPKTLMHMKM